MNYYIVMEEWNYPTESGWGFVMDYDTLEEAKAKARELAEKEGLDNFAQATKCDPLPATDCINPQGENEGCIVTCKNGLDNWYYFARIITVVPHK